MGQTESPAVGRTPRLGQVRLRGEEDGGLREVWTLETLQRNQDRQLQRKEGDAWVGRVTDRIQVSSDGCSTREGPARLGGAGTCGPHPCFSRSPVQAMGIKTALPAAELGLYSLVLSGALAYAGRGLLEASQGNRWALGHGPGGPTVLIRRARNLEAVEPKNPSDPGSAHGPKHHFMRSHMHMQKPGEKRENRKSDLDPVLDPESCRLRTSLSPSPLLPAHKPSPSSGWVASGRHRTGLCSKATLCSQMGPTERPSGSLCGLAGNTWAGRW